MSAILTGTKHATPKPRIVDPSEVKVESGIPFPKTRCRPGTKWGPHLDCNFAANLSQFCAQFVSLSALTI